jgi:hypothetical protein
MIPPTLAAFRALMERAATAHDESAKVAIYFARHAKPEDDLEGFVKLSYADSATLRALATATPEQLLGIAFVIRDEYQQDTAAGPVSGYYVTPREDA